jgi:hypothetical protein
MESKYFIPIKIISDVSIIKETLQRIGIPAKQDKILYQTCHFLNYKEKDSIIHFKEFFGINNNNIDLIRMKEEDFTRRNTIIYLLYGWKLIDLDTDTLQYIKSYQCNKRMFVVSYHDKQNWNLKSKVNILENNI